MRFRLWSPDVIWKFVLDHRTSIWKGSLTKGFCFDGGNTKNAVVTGRTELSRWCINQQDPGQVFRTGIWQRTVTEGGYFVLNSSCHWQPMEWVIWKLWLWVLQLHFGLFEVYPEGIAVHQRAKHYNSPVWEVQSQRWVFWCHRQLTTDKSNWMYTAVQVFVTCWCIDKLLSSVTPSVLTRSEKSTSVSPICIDWGISPEVDALFSEGYYKIAQALVTTNEYFA